MHKTERKTVGRNAFETWKVHQYHEKQLNRLTQSASKIFQLQAVSQNFEHWNACPLAGLPSTLHHLDLSPAFTRYLERRSRNNRRGFYCTIPRHPKVTPWTTYQPLMTDIWGQITMGSDKTVLLQYLLITEILFVKLMIYFIKVFKKIQRLQSCRPLGKLDSFNRKTTPR